MSRVCPFCGKRLLSGFSPLHNHCEVELSAELLFPAEKKAAIEADELRAPQTLRKFSFGFFGYIAAA